MISSYFPPIVWTGPWWRGCNVFYRYATSHPVNRSAVWSVMCHVVLSSSEMSSLMSPSDFGEENTTALFPIKPLSASPSLAWQKQKLFVLLGIGVCVRACTVCARVCLCHSFFQFVSFCHALSYSFISPCSLNKIITVSTNRLLLLSVEVCGKLNFKPV